MSKKVLLIFLLSFSVLGSLLGIWLIIQSLQEPMEITEKLVVTSSKGFLNSPVFIAMKQNYFQEEGVDIELKPFGTGRANLKAISEGKADIASSSETPFMHAVLNQKDISVLTTVVSGEKHLGVVGRRDKGITLAEDLKGKKIGVSVGSNGEYFLDTVLILHNLTREDISIVHIRPNKMMDAIVNGEVDAIATWNPGMYSAYKALGENGVLFYSEGLYSVSFLFSARKELIAKKPEAIGMFLRGLERAMSFMREKPEEVRKIIADSTNMDLALLNELTSNYHFKLSLDQSFLVTLVNQSKWAIKRKLTERTEVPNFLEYIHYNALEEVKPEAMTIIR